MLFVLYRGVARALREDQVTVIRLFKDLEEGGVTRRYSARLTNCRGALEQLQHMARDFRGAPAAAPPLEAAPAGLGPDTGGLEVREAPQTKTIPASIFRAYDIRGIVGDTLTADIVYDIGRAIGSEACEKGQQKIVVGRDGRLSGPELSAALIKGLTAVGCDVADVGQVPTPVLYFATEYLGTGSGAMLTGSHNPANYNGLKIMLRGETLYGDGIQALRSRVQSANLTSGEGSAQSVDVAMSYIDRITSDVRLARPLKVAVDCGNGVTGELAPQLLRALGCEVVELYCEVDGTFPNHHPDPGKPENLIALTRAVTGQGADIGVAFDGDGDRIGVVDSGGKIIWPDRLLMLLAQDLLLRQPGAQIIYDVKSSRHLEQVIQSHGGQPLMWKTGHSLIKAKMRETGALLAGEMSGHIFFKERWFGFDDALYACARLLEVVSADERPSAKLFAELPESVSTPELNVGTAEGQHFKIMEQLVTDPGFPGAKLITIDGLRVEFEDGWGLVRASNTTPSLVLRFEADDAEALRRIQDAFRARLQRIDPGLDLQF
ncbi:MAG: phosphomannomutase/phosphoglucomutase [Gammaproteobacteria bacterium]|nr:phosphomannomutase/phosphoglucomutase [Gammaproteobacteria bacterium]NIR97665.1 phosphomannomutase/phosphoglucomutase [Gammaproteobacteria bacterium]NIT63326.1 phosphomannomutase/phosphoglucomutase [Gammaproteobacteria bacterium]NIV20244.1 phosphomannomutase/phosphoglucomutase [Gammaproteobacteria bacterium]NIX10661.1 phosphomannomutase/phosphoglucomutase [Gammaproteobacteria bacterium]